MAEVKNQLPENSVLIEYVQYVPAIDSIVLDSANTVENSRNQELESPRYAVYLLFPDGRIEAIDLGDAAEIDAAIQDVTTLLQDPRANFRGNPATIITEINPDRVTDVTTTLKTLLFDPIAPYIQDTDHLLISPDGELNRLPFEALQTNSGDFLVQQYQISYLSSGRDLLKFDVVEPSRNPAVILANPNYEQASDVPLPDLAEGPVTAATLPSEEQLSSGTETNRRSGDLSQLTDFAPLPGTAAEAKALAPLLPNAQILTADNATENLLKVVQAPRILHIATHGFFLPDADRVAAPTQFGDGDFTATAATTNVPLENPLLRSGLALAGFNTRSSGTEDGASSLPWKPPSSISSAPNWSSFPPATRASVIFLMAKAFMACAAPLP
ncbi:MAG: CHAT domain-containing protein [Leptolyngbya sp. SIO4C5]|nr:CHAT domain-containing protein [Leptolyngbya sp. SIO4C5]